MAMDAFDLAERLQTPVFVMSDLDLGMNMWMSEPFAYPETPPDRGKILDRETLARVGEWGRYRDVDGDGIPYRTLPGTDSPAYFARGSGHNERGQYSERADDYVNNMQRLHRKFETAKTLVPAPEVDRQPDARLGIVGFGTSHWAILESRDQLKGEAGVPTAYLRLRAYPFSNELHEFLAQYDRVYVVEQNRDAQMVSLMRMDLPVELSSRIRSVLHFNGLPIDARSITDSILAQEGLAVADASAVMEAGGSMGGE
jgi:2-oxoglutarate ferredoxin oxidoreductase subunit alpha